jgi:hypothetical protein
MRAIGVIGVALLRAARAAETCSNSTEEPFTLPAYSPEELNQLFREPWSYRKWEALSADPAQLLFEPTAGCGADSDGGDLLFAFGGFRKWGGSSYGALFNASACQCASDASLSCSACPPQDRVQGLWLPDVVSRDADTRVPDARWAHFVKYIGNGNFLLGGGITCRDTTYSWIDALMAWPLELWLYSVESRSYSPVGNVTGSAPSMRTGMCVSLVGDSKLYLAYGLNTYSYNAGPAETVHEYDLAARRWDVVFNFTRDCPLGADNVSCPALRDEASCSSVPGGFVMTGGLTPSGALLGDTWLFDAAARAWRRLAPDRGPPPHAGAVAKLSRTSGVLLLQGGVTDSGGFLEGVWVLDVRDANASGWAWRLLPAVAPAPLVQDHCGGLLSGDKLYVLGGNDNSGRQAMGGVAVFDYGSGLCPSECIGVGLCEDRVCDCPVTHGGANCNELLRQLVYLDIALWASITFTVLGTLLGAACLAAATLFYLWRRRPAILAVSPLTMTVCLFGCAMMSWGVLLLAWIPDYPDGASDGYATATALCSVQAMWFPLGWSVSVGALIAKAKHVADYFAAMDLKDQLRARRARGFWHTAHGTLMLVVGVLAGCNIVIITAMLVVHPSAYNWEASTTDTGNPLILEHVASCSENRNPLWAAALFVVNGLFAVYGAYLAWITRHVKLFQDSVRLGMAMHNVFIVTLVTIVVSRFVAPFQPTAAFCVTCSGILLSVLGVLALLALPNLYRRDMPASYVRKAVEATAQAHSLGLSQDSVDIDEDRYAALVKRVAELESELEAERCKAAAAAVTTV